MRNEDQRRLEVRDAVAELLVRLGSDLRDPNLADTPERVAKWLLSHFPSEEDYADAFKELRGAVFPTKYQGIIAQTGIRANGLCPHHLLPVSYDVAVGYIPDDSALGLSKLARVANLTLSRAGLQEDLTATLAKSLQELLGIMDVAVVVRGRHSCMSVRGVKMHSSVTTTSEMRGLFRTNTNDCKTEFLQLVHNRKD